MGVFCDRLKLCSKAAPNSQSGQNKGRYRKQERSFLFVLLVRWNSQKCIFFTLQPTLHSSVVQAVAYSSHNTAASVVTANKQGGSKLLKEETTLLLAYC